MNEELRIDLTIETNNARVFIDELEALCQRWAVEDEDKHQVYQFKFS